MNVLSNMKKSFSSLFISKKNDKVKNENPKEIPLNLIINRLSTDLLVTIGSYLGSDIRNYVSTCKSMRVAIATDGAQVIIAIKTDCLKRKLFKALGGPIPIDPNNEAADIESNFKALSETRINHRGIINACGGLNNIIKFPILCINKERFQRLEHEGYYRRGIYDDNLRFLTTEDTTAPVMRGLNPWGKPFLVFRLEVRRSLENTETTVEAIYERGGYWAGSDHALQIFVGRHGALEDSGEELILDRISKLIRKEPVGIVHGGFNVRIDEPALDGSSGVKLI